MAIILTSELIPDIEKAFRRVSLSGQRAMTDADLSESGLSRFSVEDLIEKAEYSAMYIAAVSESVHLPELIGEESPSGGSFDLSDKLRLLGGRVSAGSQPALRRTRQDHLDKESTGVPASEDYPAYIFEDASLEVYTDEKNPPEATASFIHMPKREWSRGVNVQYSSGRVTATGARFNPSHVGTVMRLTPDDGSGEIEREILSVQSNTARIDHGGGQFYGEASWYSPAYSRLNNAFHWPIVNLAVAQAQTTVGNFGAMEVAMNAHNREMRDYTASQFDLRDAQE